MTAAALEGAVELLDRSLAYTRGTLAGVHADLVSAPTPCRDWRLGRLLAHMDDALDAFTDAASGYVDVRPVAEPASRVESLREKACALLAAWTHERPAAVLVGDAALESAVLVATAALEITVHGWDVGQATQCRTPIPVDLAQGLLGVADAVIAPADRPRRFAPPRPVLASADADVRLLAWCGRSESWESWAVWHDQTSEPAAINRAVPAAERGVGF